MLLAGKEGQFWTQWMRSEVRDPSALTQEDIDEYAGWTAAPGGSRTVREVYRTTEQRAETNKVLMEKKMECPVLGAGADFFFGEVPRRQMEKVATIVRGVVIHFGHNIALEKPKELAEAYLSFFEDTL